MKYAQQQKLVEDLRELADLIEDHGHKLPITATDYYPLRLTNRFYGEGAAAKAQLVRAARNIPGKLDKRYSLGDLELVKSMKNNLVQIVFETNQDNVCTKRVVGYKEVPERVVVETGMTTKEEIVEYDCDPLLAPPKLVESDV